MPYKSANTIPEIVFGINCSRKQRTRAYDTQSRRSLIIECELVG